MGWKRNNENDHTANSQMADGLKKTGTRKLTISLEFYKFHRSELLFGLMRASTGSWSKTLIKSCVL